MDSDNSEEEHEIISKQIVDYYRKYSQNKQLPRYFSGTSLSYMPQIVRDEEIGTNVQPLIIIEDTEEKPTEEEAAEVKAVSPASSVTSNRKLEWDNGADIGYTNYVGGIKLHKSLSLPILLGTDNKKVDKLAKTKLTKEIVSVISYSSPEVQVQSSSSSSSYKAEVPIQSSSSSYRSNPKQISSSSSSFTNTIAYLKSKIGTPDAESTPKVDTDVQKVYTVTPLAPKLKKHTMKHKIINLCMTKPIVIECFDQKKKTGSNKKVQTSYIEAVSKCVQTSDSLEMIPEELPPVENPIENQSVIIIHYNSDGDKKTSSSNTQTDAELIESQCDSFEYYRDTSKNKDNLKRSCAKSDLVSTDSSKEFPVLAQLISEKQSKSLIKDVDKSIAILQKLLKSKKYDPATKKRYIKKIVEKIVDSKYKDDSTTSSELFIPKKQDEAARPKLEKNMPWYPPQVSKFTVKTFSEDYLPHKPSDSLDTGSSFEKQPNVSSESYQSWKEDKTLSERLLEEKQKGQGDHLVKFAEKERQHQIAWINDEISHLTKLKGLLEKKIQTTTTVYMVSQHYDHPDENSCSSNSQRNPPRNYVIQTELSESTSSDAPVDYNLYDESGKRNYQVTELTAKREEMNIHKKVVGEIEVVSDDKTTNIKVKTKKVDADDANVFKPKPPNLVGPGKYDTFPKSKAEEDQCWPCGRSRPSTSRARTNGARDGKPYSVEIPLNSENNLSEKVNEIINKYRTDSTVEPTRKCSSACKCMETFRNMLREKTEYLRDHKKEIEEEEIAEPVSRPCLCKYKEIKCDRCKYKDAETIELQFQKEREKDSSEASARKLTVQVPLDSTNVIGKVAEDILYTAESSSEGMKPCKCCCKCMGLSKVRDSDVRREINNRESSKAGSRPCYWKDKENKMSSTTELPKTDDSEIICCCRGTNTVEIELQRETNECKCCNKNIQTCICTDKSVGTKPVCATTGSSTTSSSSESTSSTTGTESLRSCICCKQKNVTSKHLYALREQLSDQAYPFCRPCYRQNRRGTYSVNYYDNPGHVCNCYTVVQTKTLDEIKKTIGDLNDLDNQYCTCVDAGDRNDSDYCKHCKCKLKQTSKNRNGIAYMLTFENVSVDKDKKKKKHKKKPYLEEIKVKIPIVHKKKHKDKENKRKKAKQSYDSEESSTSGTRKYPSTSLQEYLKNNRPGFVQGAEGRRQTVNESRTQREEMSDYNKLMFLKKCQEECERMLNTKKLFSEKEMKDITRRNYKKLPEVQQRLTDNREKQLRQASRLMADTFNRKLRENVLNGKKNLPTDVNVINM